jgi:hypothetical protein
MGSIHQISSRAVPKRVSYIPSLSICSRLKDKNSNGAEIIAEVQAEIQAHLDPNSGVDKSWKRNASLAWLTLSFENGSSFVEGEASGRIPFLLTYLEKYGEATTAYNDLRRFAERLGLEERVQLVRVLTGNTLFGDSDRLRDEKIQSRGMLRPSDEDVSSLMPPEITSCPSSTDKFSLPPPTKLLD